MRWVWICASLALGACDDGGGRALQEGPAQDAGPEGLDAAQETPACSASAIYDLTGVEDGIFPDDIWARPARTGSGMQIDLSMENAPWLERIPESYRSVFLTMNTLDGWGTSAPIFVRFDGAIALPEPGAVRLVAWTDDGPEDVEVVLGRYDDGETLELEPVRPLREATRHTLIVTDAVTAEAGGCVAPAAGLAIEAVALDALEIPADTVLSMGSFTTQTVTDNSRLVAENIVRRTFDWAGPPQCQQQRNRRRCERAMRASDYRDEDGVITAPRPKKGYDLPVSIWIPEGRGPFPTIIAGHGLSGDRSLGGGLDAFITESAVVVGIDSPYHGEHPAGASPNPVFLLRDFFAVDLGRRTVDALRLRDNFRTATFDKLQLLELLKQQPDLDGDGFVDVDVDRIAYFGVSLGGIHGGEFLALADGIGAAVLSVPGARLTQIMRDSQSFGPLVSALVPGGAGDGEVRRVFGAIQTVIESGDPVNFAPRVLQDRLPRAGTPPDLLLVMAVDDEVVPNSSTASLARALGVPIVPPAALDWDHIEVADAAPLEANMESGATAGLSQYDDVTFGTPPQIRRGTADHNNTTVSREATAQFRQFFSSWLAGSAEIIAP